jgi:hypothetical protein
VSNLGLLQSLLSQGNIAFPKWGSTLTLKQQPDGKYAVMLDGVELPIIGFETFTPPSVPQRPIHGPRGEVYIQTGGLQPGTLGITLLFTKLEIVNGQGQPVEEHPYRREGLDL